MVFAILQMTFVSLVTISAKFMTIPAEFMTIPASAETNFGDSCRKARASAPFDTSIRSFRYERPRLPIRARKGGDGVGSHALYSFEDYGGEGRCAGEEGSVR